MRRYLGSTGLVNLGNTCYMNAALQCIAHATPLVHYFLEEKEAEELNTECKITQGKIALSFSKLVREMWGGSKSLAPRAYKSTAGSVDQRWRGFDQQDAHEHVLFLLGCLHDDLNRIKGRPKHGTINENQPDEELAQAVMQDERRVNDSIIDDLFKGVYRSRVTCPDCNHTATKFEHYYDLQLPFPHRNFHQFRATLLPRAGAPLASLNIKLPPSSTIQQLKQRISQSCDIKYPQQLLVVSLQNNNSFQTVPDTLAVSEIKPNQSIFIFELPLPSTDNQRFNYSLETVLVTVHQHARLSRRNEETWKDQSEPICWPFMMLLPRKCSYSTLRRLFEARVASFITIDKGADPSLINDFELYLTHNGQEVLLADYSHIRLNEKTQLTIQWGRIGAINGYYKLVQNPVIINTVPGVTLQDCFEAHVQREKLSENDQWMCPHCKKLKQAIKQMDLWNAPPLLTIQLKRFQSRQGMPLPMKCDTPVSYPVEGLNLGSFLKSKEAQAPATYNLYGVVCHMGMLAQLGHYTAYAKNPVDGCWYYFDDDSVTKSDLPNPFAGYEFPWTEDEDAFMTTNDGLAML